ncbi:MAG: twin-arginine translocation signal domain-containing protein [Betaproteobacteria bacterium]|nr:MAG: twin-arginine translocation signal domain-containing protein [Betaproteobacteria bacterium]
MTKARTTPSQAPEDESGLDRRGFLKGAAAAGAATAAAMTAATQIAQAAEAKPAQPEGEANMRGNAFVSRPGSDFMVDVIKSIGIDYISANPASSFRSLHESIVNYGGNKKPEFLTCMHEESSVAMAHGYAKAAGKPMAVLCHSSVGLQHASMAVYNAWVDRAPILMFAGNGVDAAKRRPGVEWTLCVQDPAALVRDFVKWDDQPGSLQHFAESTVRAYKMMMSPPQDPVLITLDIDLQEEPIHGEKLSIPKLSLSAPPQADARALREAAKMLVAAQNPVIVADRCVRSQEGVDALVKLAETLQCPVICNGSRMNFPSTHYLNLSESRPGLIRNADVILMLEVQDPFGTLHSMGDPWKDVRRAAKPDVKVIHITLADFLMKSNYQDFQRFQPVDLPISGDAQTSIAPLTEEVKRGLSSARAAELAGKADATKKRYRDMQERTKTAAALGWDASPVSTARLSAELWNAIRNENYCLAVSDRVAWPKRLWPTTKYHNMMGGSGAAGVGYSAPGAVGVALANRDKGILTVTLQPDGDMCYAPGVLWTAAHHKIPLLIVMFNNRGYVQEVMHLQRMAGLHRRDPKTAKVGTMIYDPEVDFAKLAQSFGVWGEGPISDPDKVGPALERGLKIVKGGAPALVDVVCQLR